MSIAILKWKFLHLFLVLFVNGHDVCFNLWWKESKKRTNGKSFFSVMSFMEVSMYTSHLKNRLASGTHRSTDRLLIEDATTQNYQHKMYSEAQQHEAKIERKHFKAIEIASRRSGKMKEMASLESLCFHWHIEPLQRNVTSTTWLLRTGKQLALMKFQRAFDGTVDCSCISQQNRSIYLHVPIKLLLRSSNISISLCLLCSFALISGAFQFERRHS